ncbi:MAG: MOSC domain-containing protein [Hyphomicrobium sp.]
MPPKPDSPLGRLLDGPVMPGKLVWVGVRGARQAPMLTPDLALLIAERGIDGDHYETRRNGPRQVTLIATEDIAAIASFLGRERIDPGLLRRNLVTQGVNVMALKSRRFWIGGALCEGSGECAPCSRMEAALGPGGYSAVRGHGGITARVIEGGEVKIGDAVKV